MQPIWAEIGNQRTIDRPIRCFYVTGSGFRYILQRPLSPIRIINRYYFVKWNDFFYKEKKISKCFAIHIFRSKEAKIETIWKKLKWFYKEIHHIFGWVEFLWLVITEKKFQPIEIKIWCISNSSTLNFAANAKLFQQRCVKVIEIVMNTYVTFFVIMGSVTSIWARLSVGLGRSVCLS